MAVVVTGIGLVSALGSDADQTWQSLLSGKSAIALRQPFPELRPRPLAMLGKQPAKLDKLLIAATQATIQDAGLSGICPTVASSLAAVGDIKPSGNGF
jgi:3-oxoacyl-[acyl-carrier-protein] synthase II